PGWVSHLLQRLVLSLWSRPGLDLLLAHAADTYRRRREGLLDALERRGIAARRRRLLRREALRPRASNRAGSPRDCPAQQPLYTRIRITPTMLMVMWMITPGHTDLAFA